MSSIDDRIVQMQFNNRQFESGVQTSIKSLDNLKNGLNLGDASRSLSNLERAGRSFSLAGIAEGVEHISKKFSLLGIMGITAIQNITNSAINAGKRMISQVVVEPVTAGFTKYEQKIAAVKTIMNSTGKSVEEVNGYLDKLMWFSDETSYGFTDMTAALAQMTSSGGDVGNLIPLITGVANATAFAGKGAAEFSRAMYNLNQSYGSGNLQYMDWRSLELAGVAGKDLKQVFIDSGIALGKLKKGGKTAKGTLVDIGTFGTTLAEKWATTEVMEMAFGKFSELSEAAYELVNEGKFNTAAEAMEHLAGQFSRVAEEGFKAAQQAKTFTEAMDATKDAVSSGWMKTFEIIFGNIEEATILFTDVTNLMWEMFASGAEARNELLEEWKELGGRDSMIEGFWSLVEAIELIVEPIKEAFRDFFPPMTAEKLFAFTEGLKEFIEKLKIGEETSAKIKSTFRGVFAFLDILRQGFVALAKVAGGLFQLLFPAISSLLDFSASFGEYVVSVNEALKSSDAINKAFERVSEIIGSVVAVVTEKLTTFGNFIKGVTDRLRESMGGAAEAFSSFGSVDLSGVDSFADKIRARFQPLTKLGEIVGKVFRAIGDAAKKMAPGFFKMAGIIGDAFSKLGTLIWDAISNAEFDKIFDIINGSLFAAILLGARQFMKSITDVIGQDDLGGYLRKGIVGTLGEVRDTLWAYQTQLKAGALMKIALAVGVLALSLFLISMIDSKKLTGALAAMGAMFGQLIGAMALFEKTLATSGLKGMAKTTLAIGVMVAMSVAVLILAIALKKISDIDPGSLTAGVAAIALLSAVLMRAANVLSKNPGKMMAGAAGLVIFAIAISMLARSVKKLGEMDPVELAKGLLAVSVLIGALGLFTALAKLDNMSVGTGVGILAMAVAIGILASVVKTFSKMDSVDLLRGVYGMMALLAGLAIFIRVIDDSSIKVSTAVSIMVIGVAMLIFARAIEKIGKLPIRQIVKGLGAIAGVLILVTAALRLMPDNVLAKSVALIAIATALVIMSKALETMGKMTWDEIARGLVMLAGALTFITVAMLLMKTALPGAAALLVVAMALSILAVVLNSFGKMTWEEIGKGLLMLAAVFAIIGVAGLLLTPLIPVLLALSGSMMLFGLSILAIGAGLLLFSAGMAALAVSGAAGGAALVLILTGIVGLIPAILKKLGEGLIEFAKVLGDGAPALSDALTKMVLAFLANTVVIIPAMVQAGIDLILALLGAIESYIPKLVEVGYGILLGFLEGIANNIEAMVQVGIDIAVNFINGVSSKLPDIIEAGYNFVISYINGLADAIRKNEPLIFEACSNLVDAIVGTISQMGSRFITLGGDILSGMIKGLSGRNKAIKDAAKGIGTAALDGANQSLGIKSPSKAFAAIGKYSALGFVGGLKKFAGDVASEATNVGNTAMDSLRSAVSHISDVVNGEVDMFPTIRPVFDLAGINSGGKAIDSLFSKQHILDLNTSNNKAALISKSMSSDGNAQTRIQHALDDLKGVVREVAESKVDLSGTLEVQVRNDRGEIIGIVRKEVSNVFREASR